MRFSQIVALLLALIPSEIFAQTALTKIKDENLIRALDTFLDSVKISKAEKGVITVNFESIIPTRSRRTNQQLKSGGEIIETTLSTIRMSFRQDWTFFQYNMPEFIMLHKGRLFLFYTGAEVFFESTKESVKNLHKRLKKELPEIDGKVIGPILWVKIDNGNISIIKKM